MLLGERLAKSRKRAGLSQIDVATALNRDRTLISHVEAGRVGLRSVALATVARELDVSADYLLGLTDDPTPVADRNGAGGRAIAEIRGVYDANDSAPNRSPVEVLELAPAAGVGAEAYDETPIGFLWFRNDWLQDHSIDPEQANITSVRGSSMEPTLPDGCSILVDHIRTEPHEGRIYVMRTEEGLVVKRVGKDEEGRWQSVSDHPDWETVPMLYGTEIIGEVRWSAVTY